MEKRTNLTPSRVGGIAGLGVGAVVDTEQLLLGLIREGEGMAVGLLR
ncbi:MAG: Clp protease N-terminal domain-containing protein [Chloroflexota bacterium]